jgi:hypothetical protein
MSKVFISHGHNEVVKLKLRNFVKERLGFEPMVLAEQPDEGLTVIEKLEKHASGCVFALIVLTADDETADGGSRARQNVIHELGYCQGLLGRKKVLLLKQASVKLFSNISGLIYKEFEENHIESIYEDIRCALESGNAQLSGETIPEAESKPKIDFLSPLTQKHATEIIERICVKIDEIGRIEPQEQSRKLLLHWLQGQLEDSKEAIESLGSTIAKNEKEGGLGVSFANIGHATNLSDQKKRRAALEVALEELETNSEAETWARTLSSEKETMKILVD